MECRECGAEIPIGSYFCSGCGRPLGAGAVSGPGADVEEPTAIPPPGPSRETRRGRDERGGHFICPGCQGAFPLAEGTSFGLRTFCTSCGQARRATATREDARVGAHLAPPGTLVRERDLHGRGRFLLVAGFLAVLSIGAAFAVPRFFSRDRIDELTAGTSRDPGREFSLTSRFEVGARQVYDLRFRVEFEGSSDGPDGRRNMEANALVAAVLSVETVETDDAGGARLHVRVQGTPPTGKAVVDGREQPLDEATKGTGLSDSEFIVRVDRFGRPEEEIEVLSGDPGALKDLFLARWSEAPERALRSGDKWSASAGVPIGSVGFGGGSSAGATADFRVEGFRRHAGRDCAVISVEGGIDPEAGRNSVGGMFSMALDGRLKGAHLFDVDAGLVVKSALDLEFSLELSGNGGGADFEGRGQFDVELRESSGGTPALER